VQGSGDPLDLSDPFGAVDLPCEHPDVQPEEHGLVISISVRYDRRRTILDPIRRGVLGDAELR
jgi:hypothetical protein